MIEIQLQGIPELDAALDRWERDVIEVIAKEVDASGEHLLHVSQQLAPLLTGELMGSGTKDIVRVDEILRQISTTIGFHRPYARRMHESVYNPGVRTRGKPPVDGMVPGRKYIEQPLRRYAQEYLKRWAGAIANTGLR